MGGRPALRFVSVMLTKYQFNSVARDVAVARYPRGIAVGRTRHLRAVLRACANRLLNALAKLVCATLRPRS